MAVKIRLARGGAKKKPYYRIVVANATAPRDGDFLEKVGTYNPLLPKGDANRITFKVDRVNYWLSQGATPTETVAKFIANGGIKLPEFITSKMEVKNKARQLLSQKKAALAEAEKAAEAAKVAAEEAAEAAKAQEVTAAPVEVAPTPAEEAPAAPAEEVASPEEASVDKETPAAE